MRENDAFGIAGAAGGILQKGDVGRADLCAERFGAEAAQAFDGNNAANRFNLRFDEPSKRGGLR